MPNDHERFDVFLDIINNSDSDKVILESAEKEYSKEIKTITKGAEDFAKDAWEKITSRKSFDTRVTNPTHSTPTFIDQQIESNIKDKKPSAVNAVMRPELPKVEKKSEFFKDVKYYVSLDEVEAKKKLNNNLTLGSSIDIFDKSIGTSLEKQYGNGDIRLKGQVEYRPFDNSCCLNVNYSTPQKNIYGNVDLNKDNPGVNAGYYNRINKRTFLGINAGIYKDDAAFEVNYKKQFINDKSNLTMGFFGSTRYKEIGLRARIGF